jgi:hypothetical protein
MWFFLAQLSVLDGFDASKQFVHKLLVDFLAKENEGNGLVANWKISSPTRSPNANQSSPEMARKRRQKASSVGTGSNTDSARNESRGSICQKTAPKSQRT